MSESFPKPETIEKPPILETAEQELTEMNEEMGEFLSELDTAEKNTDDENLREQIKELRNEAKFSADWWAGNILAFTNLVVGDGINFSAPRPGSGQAEKETLEEMRERAKKELAENGITSEQMKTYQPINDVLRRGISPFGYNIPQAIVDLIPNLILGSDNFEDMFRTRGFSRAGIAHRQDSWRLYLGIPQKNDTFEISDYNPKGTKEYCYKLNDFWIRCFGGWDKKSKYRKKEVQGLVNKLKEKGGTYIDEDTYVFVMRNFSFHLGEDEKGKYIDYDDVWDLNVFPENEKGFFGKPFHIYDRLYYDPETYEPIYE